MCVRARAFRKKEEKKESLLVSVFSFLHSSERCREGGGRAKDLTLKTLKTSFFSVDPVFPFEKKKQGP